MRLAPVLPRPSVLPPGAGNEEAKKAVKTGKQRAKKTEERSVVEVRAVQRNLDVAAIARHDDGDTAAVLAIEQAQDGLQNNMAQPTRAVRAVYEALGDDATTRTTPLALVRPTRWIESSGRRRAGHQETAGCPTVSPRGLIHGWIGLLPALTSFDDECGAGKRGEDHDHTEGLSLEHAGHRVSPSASRRRP